MSKDQRQYTAASLDLLSTGELEIVGRMPWSSNATFVCKVTKNDAESMAVYKPGRGERPLWDFPSGLYKREVAAYEMSEALGLHCVPETILRDGPFDEGSLQRFVEADFEQHYFTLLNDEHNRDQLRNFAIFDLVINNADRKGGHLLASPDGRILGIDHGLCFHVEDKLRTVIWEFGGEAIPDNLRTSMISTASRLPNVINDLLSAQEVDELCQRLLDVAALEVIPVVDEDERFYPWPLV